MFPVYVAHPKSAVLDTFFCSFYHLKNSNVCFLSLYQQNRKKYTQNNAIGKGPTESFLWTYDITHLFCEILLSVLSQKQIQIFDLLHKHN